MGLRVSVGVSVCFSVDFGVGVGVMSVVKCG